MSCGTRDGRAEVQLNSDLSAVRLWMQQLRAAGVSLREQDGALMVRGPAHVLTPPMQHKLKLHKEWVLEVLRDELDLWEERAAIVEYDGKLPRPQAELAAGVGMRRFTPEHGGHGEHPAPGNPLAPVCSDGPCRDFPRSD